MKAFFINSFVIGLMVLLAMGGRAAGKWYGSYLYRQEFQREGLIGSLALTFSNREEKLRAEWAFNGLVWGCISALGVFVLLSKAAEWSHRATRPESNENRTPPC